MSNEPVYPSFRTEVTGTINAGGTGGEMRWRVGADIPEGTSDEHSLARVTLLEEAAFLRQEITGFERWDEEEEVS